MAYNDKKPDRNGLDELSAGLLIISLIIIVIAAIFQIWALLVLAGIIMAIAYYRIFSKNASARYVENKKYLDITSNTKASINNFKKRRADKKTHKIFKCPNCSQKIRAPRGKGLIEIKCPSCRIIFRANTGNNCKND